MIAHPVESASEIEEAGKKEKSEREKIWSCEVSATKQIGMKALKDKIQRKFLELNELENKILEIPIEEYDMRVSWLVKNANLGNPERKMQWEALADEENTGKVLVKTLINDAVYQRYLAKFEPELFEEIRKLGRINKLFRK